MRLSTPAAIVDCVVIFKVAILSQLSGHKHQIETLGSNPFRCESFVIFCFVFTQTSVWRCPIWRTFDSQVLVDTRTPGSLGFQGKPWICWLKPGLPCQGPSWIMSRDLKIRRCGTPGLCVCFADDEIWYEKLYFIYILTISMIQLHILRNIFSIWSKQVCILFYCTMRCGTGTVHPSE